MPYYIILYYIMLSLHRLSVSRDFQALFSTLGLQVPALGRVGYIYIYIYIYTSMITCNMIYIYIYTHTINIYIYIYTYIHTVYTYRAEADMTVFISSGNLFARSVYILRNLCILQLPYSALSANSVKYVSPFWACKNSPKTAPHLFQRGVDYGKYVYEIR